MKIIQTILVLSAILFAIHSDACSTFCLRFGDRIVFGKNYDWNIEDGMLFVNKRGMTHASDVSTQKTIPARWISRFGNVTFNQYGRNFPSGGKCSESLLIGTT